MASTKRPGLMYKVPFEADTQFGKYKDALYYTVAQYTALSETQLTNAINARINNWIATMQSVTTANNNVSTEEIVLKLTANKQEALQLISDIETQIKQVNG